MTRRRRIPRDQTDRSAWDREREERIDRDRRTGLGIRPAAWWTFDSDRPDLAANPADDTYAHLRGEEYVQGARVRLSYLARSGELTDVERAAIHRGAGAEPELGRYAWRSRLLKELAQ